MTPRLPGLASELSVIVQRLYTRARLEETRRIGMPGCDRRREIDARAPSSQFVFLVLFESNRFRTLLPRYNCLQRCELWRA